MWVQLSFVLSQITRLTDGRTDRPTDRQTAFSWLDREKNEANMVVSVTV